MYKNKVTKEVAKAIELVKNGFYNINTLEKAINNKGVELHVDVKPLFEQLNRYQIIEVIFDGYEIEANEGITEDMLPKAFRVKRSSGNLIYHVVIVNNIAYVGDAVNNASASYTLSSVVGYINGGTWVIIDD